MHKTQTTLKKGLRWTPDFMKQLNVVIQECTPQLYRSAKDGTRNTLNMFVVICYPDRCSWLTPPTFFMVFACLSSNVWRLYDYLFFVHKYSHSFFLQILYNKVIFRNNLDLQRNTKQFCCKVHFMLKIHICTPRVAIIFSQSKGLFMGFFV